jgi:hypothetical protein
MPLAPDFADPAPEPCDNRRRMARAALTGRRREELWLWIALATLGCAVEQSPDVREGVLHCTYGGENEGTFERTHGLHLEFAHYRVLTLSGQFEGFLAAVCHVSLDGCDLGKAAQRSEDNRRAFRLWAAAFEKAGRVTRLVNGFRGDPALLWRMQHPPLEDSSFAIAYDEKLQTGVLATCLESRVGTPSTDEPDNQCAIRALRRAYHNQHTEFLPHPHH